MKEKRGLKKSEVTITVLPILYTQNLQNPNHNSEY